MLFRSPTITRRSSQERAHLRGARFFSSPRRRRPPPLRMLASVDATGSKLPTGRAGAVLLFALSSRFSQALVGFSPAATSRVPSRAGSLTSRLPSTGKFLPSGVSRASSPHRPRETRHRSPTPNEFPPARRLARRSLASQSHRAVGSPRRTTRPPSPRTTEGIP